MLDANGAFTITVAVEKVEKQLNLKSTDRSGNSRQRILSIVQIDTNRVTNIDWNCPVEGMILTPTSEEISAHGTAYPSMKIHVTHGQQTSVVQTDSQGNWAISVKRITGAQLMLVFESISDNIIVVTKTYQVE